MNAATDRTDGLNAPDGRLTQRNDAARRLTEDLIA
jgi:hypothetical protein